jgi:CelD/BcsL family acetyltransferase involved in cellulose biosynthesis
MELANLPSGCAARFWTDKRFLLLRLKVARSAAEIDELRSAWMSMVAPGLSLFQSFRWNRLAAEHFATREAPYFVFVENDNGAAIIPAVINTECAELGIAGERLFDYRDYLAIGDRQPLEHAWEHLASLSLSVSIAGICRPEAAIWKRLPKAFFSRAPKLSPQEITSEQFLTNHSRAFSRLRKLERLGLEIRQYSGQTPVVREIYQRRARESASDELFRDPLRVAFMIAVCREEASHCEVFTFEHGGTLAAALVTFRDDDFRRFYTTYYNRAWARYSPGVSLLFEISRRSLEQGLSFDLMTGEQSYKMRIAQSAQDLFEVKATAAELRAIFPFTTEQAA